MEICRRVGRKRIGDECFSTVFLYSALTLIPLSLPFGNFISRLKWHFGNFGERYELLSMKAAVFPYEIIRPLIIFWLSVLYLVLFQNVIAPKAQIKLLTLLVSMKQTSPELDIPEGVFYDEIEGYNIYVKQKDRETGMLKDVLIYNFSDGFWKRSHYMGFRRKNGDDSRQTTSLPTSV